MKRLVISLALWSGLAHASPLTILIDAGHGGRDHGAVRNGVHEADITLAVSRDLRDLLKRDHRFQVSLSREDDDSVSLYRRARMAKDKKADLFLSIHVNSSPDARAKGAEFYFQNQLTPDQESMLLAHKEDVAEAGEEGGAAPQARGSPSVQPITYDYLDKNNYSPEVASILNDLLDSDRVWRSSEFSKALKIKWRGTRKSKTNSVRQAPFYVLNQMRTPSTLVELGFLTNADDFRELTDPAVQHKMAEDLYHGIVAYKESMDKGT